MYRGRRPEVPAGPGQVARPPDRASGARLERELQLQLQLVADRDPVLAVAFAAAGQPWYLVLAFGLYAAWAALGAYIDIVRPIPWRRPPRWGILLPYAGLLVTALLAFWIPLWWVDRGLWVAFGVLYAAHTTLNVLAHRKASV
jgi:hypothetical protein